MYRFYIRSLCWPATKQSQKRTTMVECHNMPYVLLLSNFFVLMLFKHGNSEQKLLYLSDDTLRWGSRWLFGCAQGLSHCHHHNLHNDCIAAAGLIICHDSGSAMQGATIGASNSTFCCQYQVLCIDPTLRSCSAKE